MQECGNLAHTEPLNMEDLALQLALSDEERQIPGTQVIHTCKVSPPPLLLLSPWFCICIKISIQRNLWTQNAGIPHVVLSARHDGSTVVWSLAHHLACHIFDVGPHSRTPCSDIVSVNCTILLLEHDNSHPSNLSSVCLYSIYIFANDLLGLKITLSPRLQA